MIRTFAAIEPLESRIALAFAAIVDLEDYTAAEGFKISGGRNEDHLGNSVAVAGDINGDGFADILVAAKDGNRGPGGTFLPDAGDIYVIFGGPVGPASPFDPLTLDGENGFLLIGEERDAHAGISASGAGDVNGDGFDDLIIGSVNDRIVGAAYVVFGKAGGYPAETRSWLAGRQ